MKPIGIGIQQWLHMGMVFLLERPRTAGQYDPNFNKNAKNCRDSHIPKDAVEIILHFINGKY